MVHGILLVDKPNGPTSHGIVSVARRALGTRKVGHAGTLDPMATGLLVLGVGTATRLLTFLVGDDKTYEATIRLGAATVTDDALGETVSTATPEQIAAVTEGDITRIVATLTGEIDQRPSAVSAIKVDGRRAYDRVREGESVELPARRVTVHRFAVLSMRRTDDGIELDVVVDCSSGTYIRALARDLGEQLGVGGHLTSLRRTRVGALTVDKACPPEDITPDRLMTPADAARARFPVWEVSPEERESLRHGKKVEASVSDAPLIAALSGDELIAIVSVNKGVARVVTGFPHA